MLSTKSAAIVGTRYFSVFGGNQFSHRPRVDVSHELHGIIKWVKPERLKAWEAQRTCDLKPLPKIDPNWIKLEFRPFASMINALPEDQRKLFTVALAPRREAVQVIMEDTLDNVRRHKYDNESMEVKIAWMTVKIRNLQFLLHSSELCRRDGGFRKSVKELVEKRKKYMSKLKNLDYKRFEWVLEVLSVIYKPNPDATDRVERKKSFIKLTELYCEAIRQKRMNDYKAELETQKIPFLEEKLATLQKIKEDEVGMRIPCSVEDDITKTLKQIEDVKLSHMVLKEIPQDQKQVES